MADEDNGINLVTLTECDSYSRKYIGSGYLRGITTSNLNRVARVLGIDTGSRKDICKGIMERKITSVEFREAMVKAGITGPELYTLEKAQEIDKHVLEVRKEMLSQRDIMQSKTIISPPLIRALTFGDDIKTNLKAEVTVDSYNPKNPPAVYKVGDREVIMPPFQPRIVSKKHAVAVISDNKGIPDPNYNYQPSSYNKINCGFNTQKAYKIRNNVCTALAHKPLRSFLEGEGCSQVSRSIATNIVRVAAQRIFADAMRSLMEPISNSIDACRKKNGHPTIGKFGMGFFSILYWLQKPTDYIIVESISEIPESPGRYCHWSAYISKPDEDYTFVIYDSYAIKPGSRKVETTGVMIHMFLEQTKETYRLSIRDVEDAIVRTFRNVRDINITRVGFLVESTNFITVKPTRRIGSLVDNGNLIDEIFVAYMTDRIIYFDNFTGIDINTFLTSLLIPSISNKIPPSPLIGYRTPSFLLEVDNGRKTLANYNTQLNITVGDITVISIIDNPFYYSENYYSQSEEEKKDFIYTLSLPSNTPLPVSRDDVILENPFIFEIARLELISLIEQTLIKGNVESLYRMIFMYSNKSNTSSAYQLANAARDYINLHPKIYLTPRGYEPFYRSLTAVLVSMGDTDLKFVTSDSPQYNKIRDMVLNKFKGSIRTDLIHNFNVISIKITEGDFVSTGGLTDILFCDISLNTVSNIIQKALPMIISTEPRPIEAEHREGVLVLELFSHKFLPKHKQPLIDAIMTASFREKIPSYDINFLYNYVGNYLNAIYSMTTDENYKQEFTNLLYSTFIKVMNRSLHYSNNRGTSISAKSVTFINPVTQWDEYKNKDGKEITWLGIKTQDIDIRNRVVLDYLVAYVSIQLSGITESSQKYIFLKDPFSYHLLGATHYLAAGFRILKEKDPDIAKDEKLYIKSIIEFIIDKHPVYYHFFNRLFFDYIEEIRDGKINFLAVLTYIHYELKNRYNVTTLIEGVKIMGRNGIPRSSDLCDSIYRGLRLSLDIFNSISTRELPRFSPEEQISVSPEVPMKAVKFTGMQLVNYLFRHEVDMKSTRWLDEVPTASKITDMFKIYDIAINDGTTKSYGNSIITELLQNSIDASRAMQQRRKAANETTYIEPNDYTIRLITRTNNDPTLISGNEITEYTESGFGEIVIGLIDVVGIPTSGLISALIPFLSTKTSKEELSTGEMGTGFMNIFRQPYTSRVDIKTVNPDTLQYFHITVIPIVEKGSNRAKDIKIIFRRSGAKIENIRGTSIFITLNPLSNLKLGSILAEINVYAYNNFYPVTAVTGITTEINGKIISDLGDEIEMVFDSDIASIYLTKSESDARPSVLLTNGVPFSELESVVGGLWSDEKSMGWLEYCYHFGIYINLKKGNYKPVQSRKDIILSDNDRLILMALITYACIQRVIIRFIAYDLDDYYLNGITNKGGSFDANMPGDGRDRAYEGFYLGENIGDTVVENIGIKGSIGSSIRYMVEYCENKKLKPNFGNIYKEIFPAAGKAGYVIRGPHNYAWLFEYWLLGKKLSPDQKDVVVLAQGDGNISVNIRKGQKPKVSFNPKKAAHCLKLISTLVKLAWDYWQKVISGPEVNKRSDAPIIEYVDDLGTSRSGQYNSVSHVIQLSLKLIPIEDYEKEAMKFMNLWVKDNKREALGFLLNNPKLNELIGIQPESVVIAHEMCHAILGQDHSKANHGEATFTLQDEVGNGKQNIRDSFERVANMLWTRALRRF